MHHEKPFHLKKQAAIAEKLSTQVIEKIPLNHFGELIKKTIKRYRDDKTQRTACILYKNINHDKQLHFIVQDTTIFAATNVLEHERELFEQSRANFLSTKSLADKHNHTLHNTVLNIIENANTMIQNQQQHIAAIDDITVCYFTWL